MGRVYEKNLFIENGRMFNLPDFFLLSPKEVFENYQREVKPHVSDCWLDSKKNRVDYEINFNRYFYQYTPLRSLKEIADEILALERKSEGLLNQVLEKAI